MELNADFSRRAVVHAAQVPWKASPMPGVDRRMLDRMGDEVARATSIVRYAPGSAFSPHVHTGGEEFFVLEGVFQDEHGDFPAGTYVRNPPQSKHTPGSEPGCTIFVKLWQFDPQDRFQTSIDTTTAEFVPDGSRAGVEVMQLYEDDREHVCLERWAPGIEMDVQSPSGLEILVLDGSFSEGGEEFQQQSWLRLPRNGGSTVVVGDRGARVWIKRNHLADDPSPPVTG